MQSRYHLLSSVIFLQLLLLLVAPVTSDNDSDNDSDDECQNQISCADCIQLVQCVYCLDANFSREMSRWILASDWPLHTRFLLARCLARSDTSACVTVEDPANLVIREEMLNVSLGQDSASGDFVQVPDALCKPVQLIKRCSRMSSNIGSQLPILGHKQYKQTGPNIGRQLRMSID